MNIQIYFLLFSAFFVLTGHPSSANARTKTEKGELTVFKGELNDALALAKESGKPVFIKAYTEWCGHCKRFDANTLGNQQVIEFLNENFITLKVDLEKDEGPAIKDKYNVRRFPSGLFLDPSGEVIQRFTGNMGVPDFLGEAGKALQEYTSSAE